MPIYEYKCVSCGNKFELKQSFDASVEMRCPECEGKARRVISASSFRFAQSNRSQVYPNARRVKV